MIELATRIVEAIEKDFTDRRGLRQEWDQIDADIKIDIKNTWINLVLEELNEISLPVKYTYWNEGDPIPKELPEGCQVDFSDVDSGVWVLEDSAPCNWGYMTRRWPSK
jgi:hypothetical protein